MGREGVVWGGREGETRKVEGWRERRGRWWVAEVGGQVIPIIALPHFD
jgi:hypothetical protein